MSKKSTILTSPHKDTYKLRNWSDYNKTLESRGNITLWLNERLLRVWSDVPKKKVVGEQQYPDCVIEACLIIGKVYKQKLRQTVGFVKSMLRLAGYGDLAVPDYTTLNRRQGVLSVEVSRRLSGKEKLHIGIDSTGLKVYGEGEWKVRKHGHSKRRTWQKLHIGIDIDTQEIVLVKLTSNSIDDAAAGRVMLEGHEGKLKKFSGDGAYDDFSFREVLGKDVIQVIPPPSDAVVQKGTKKKPVPDYLAQRDEAVRYINEHDRKDWKVKMGYHKRSRNETVMFRYKGNFDGTLEARTEKNQTTEVNIKCKILNVFRRLGKPAAYKAA